MGRTIRLLGLALLVATSTMTTGCNLRALHIVIPDFETSQVVGVSIWKVDAGQPQGIADINFGAITMQNFGAGPIEVIEYDMTQPDGSQISMVTPVIRDPAMPGGIEIHLLFQKMVPSGLFKVSTYNAAGSSPLSTEQTYLL
ncbi:MAG: hypothetical protein JRH01_20965 [Deltaproteobacteria bacterium]|nr:hypothetical protein [Deltaproteobacteria bacterium]MBW2396325.1 hypothetical protein [Deltaproteobacteria bacterium]